jgi:hypothetical protein
MTPKEHIDYFNQIGMKLNPVSKEAYKLSHVKNEGWYVTEVDGPKSQKQGVFVYKKVLISSEDTPDLDVFMRFIELGNVILDNNIMSIPK